MENGSKALIIAGSVLVAMMVISLLVAFFANLRTWMGEEERADILEQATEFNKQYDVYYRNNIYGSELLSITNKVSDYNYKYREDDGYSKLEIQVTFKKNVISYNGERIISAGEVYNSEPLKQKIQDLENKVKSTGRQKVAGKTIESLSALRTEQLKEFGAEGAQDQINLYLGYKSALTNIKTKVFNATKFEYNNENGRIKLMKFNEN